ncbi:MAG: acyl-CoA thioesterase [Pseudomonadota bacterium]
MASPRNYFPHQEGDPAPLVAMASRRINFEEADILGMVWHGRYASYFEDGRVAFGDAYGLNYHTIRENKMIAPIAQMHLDYKLPLRIDDTIRIEAALNWTEAARLNFSYTIYNPQGQIATRGYTVQLLTDTEGVVQFYTPEWLREFHNKWRQGFWQKQG